MFHGLVRLSRGICAVSALVLLGIGGSAVAEELFYRYENAQGITVIDDHVPPKFAHKGYTVLNAQGRVVEVVPRALTQEELRDANSAAVQERLRKEEAERQRRYDEALLRRYSSVEDIRAAEERKVNDVKVRINLLKGNIASLKSQVEARQEEAAELERDGQAVPEVLSKNIADLRQEIVDAEKLISKHEAERKKIEARYKYDADRFKILRPDIPSPP